MKITESVLRKFIRETLLREGLAGPVPAAPGTAVRNKSVLSQLQAIIKAPESGVYDAATENAWDNFVDDNVPPAQIASSDTMIEKIKIDWASAAKDVKVGIDGVVQSMTFTPDIKGMLKFAEFFAPAADDEEDNEDEDDVTGDLPYRLSQEETDVWPDGLTLDDADVWQAYAFGDANTVATARNTANEMAARYDELAAKIAAGKMINLFGYTPGEIAEGTSLFPYRIKDIETLKSIFGKE